MHAIADGAQSGRVGTPERAEKIQQRLSALGISDREFAERSGVDRKALRRAAKGDPARPSTYTAIETWLDRLEAEVGRDVPPLPEGARYLGDPEDQFIEITIEGDKVIVKGPIGNIDEVRRTAAELIAGMAKSKNPENPETA